MRDLPFFKFPSTPHLLFASENISRSDKLLPEDQKERLLSNAITIEEKIDGANLGISFSQTGDILLQNRGQYLPFPYMGQWEKIPAWLDVYQDRLFDVLEDRYILFGEWCYAKHSIFYTALPDWFVAFDIYDMHEKKFFSVQRRNEMVKRMELALVPLIKHGRFAITDIPLLLCKSKYSDSPCEGLYFRYDLDGWLNVRAKYVRGTFSQTIDQHWTNAPFQKNRVIY